MCTCFIRNSCGNFCIYCGKHALCGLLQDHSVDPDTAGEETRQLLVPGRATRYIGYNPDVPDKTIHEFPCYSFVLGDLHAHVVNVMFVLFLTGLLYAWMKRRQGERGSGGEKSWSEFLEKDSFSCLISCWQQC